MRSPSVSGVHCATSLLTHRRCQCHRDLGRGRRRLAGSQCFCGGRDSRIVGYTYVDGNTVGVNTVAGYARHVEGSLTPLDGSPFPVGGAGLGASLGSQGAIQASPDGRLLIVVDAGSKPDHGIDGRRTRRLRRWRRAVQLQGPGLVGTRDNPLLIDSFTVGYDGRLMAAVGSPFPAQDLGAIGAEFRPTRPSQLFVSNARAGPNAGTVSGAVGAAAGMRSLAAANRSPSTCKKSSCAAQHGNDHRPTQDPPARMTPSSTRPKR